MSQRSIDILYKNIHPCFVFVLFSKMHSKLAEKKITEPEIAYISTNCVCIFLPPDKGSPSLKSSWSASKVNMKGFRKAQRWLRSSSPPFPFPKRQTSTLLHKRIISDISPNSFFPSARREADVTSARSPQNCTGVARISCRGVKWQSCLHGTAANPDWAHKMQLWPHELAETANTAKKSATLRPRDFGLTDNVK